MYIFHFNSSNDFKIIPFSVTFLRLPQGLKCASLSYCGLLRLKIVTLHKTLKQYVFIYAPTLCAAVIYFMFTDIKTPAVQYLCFSISKLQDDGKHNILYLSAGL